jgi:hypothetical protein
VVEGQATLEQIGSMIGSENLAMALPGGWDRVRELIRESQSSMPIFSSAPTLLQETLLFPYLSGAEWMRQFKERNPGKSPFGMMPVSTEQLMHADRYFDTRDAPTTVTLPASPGRTVYENNLGEFETRLLLYEYLRDQTAAVRGAAGWDGDRYRLVETGRGDAIVWASVWDSSIDAAEFFDLLDAGLAKFHGVERGGAGAGGNRAYTAGQRTLSLQITDVGERQVVVFTDVPRGVSPRLIDASKVTLRE